MNQWKCVSQNTISFLSLHDCECSSFYIDEHDIIMEMEWMEVLAEHPYNPFLKAHQSTEGRIEFHNVHQIQVKCGEYQNQSLEILDFDVEELQMGYQIGINAITTDKNSGKEDFISMQFICEKSTVMFNELTNVSWFETE